MRNRTLVLTVALALSACRPTAREGATSQAAELADTPAVRLSRRDTTQAPLRDSVLKLLFEYGQKFGDEPATVISRLGAPQQVKKMATVDQIDTIFVLEYPGASFEGVRWTAGQHEMLFTIRVWGPVPGLPQVMSLGSTTRSQVVTILGNPDYSKAEADTTILSYELPNPERTDLIEFYVVRDTVRVLRWRFRMG